MSYLAKNPVGSKVTPQSQPIPGSAQVPNSAGGFAWAVTDWVRLDRFLVLGTEGGTYYASERKLTAENTDAVRKCIAEDGKRVVARVVEVSEAGRAPKNDPALLVLAMASAIGDAETRKAAFEALPRVARIGTHLYQFIAFREMFGGWGRGMRGAIRRWYTERPVEALSYQLIKYRQRDGWSHRDALRLSHPKPNDVLQPLFAWAVGKTVGTEVSRLIHGYELAQRSASPKATAALVREYNLPREALLTEHLNAPEVWEAMLDAGMPMTAMIRNLATMTRAGVLAPMSEGTRKVVTELGNEDRIQKARVHPIAVLAALLTYQQGRGMRGGNTWEPVTAVVDALDRAFYLSFGNVEPMHKRTMLALDVSGSMGIGYIAGVPGMSPRVGAAAMALITAATEPSHMFTAFGTTFHQLTISPRQRLDDVVRQITLPFQGTDCSLPMLEAIDRGWEIDTFCIYTDSETWAGKMHPAQALARYRQETGINAKLVVVGMSSNGFSIADPNDSGMVDVVGFDTATPNLISDFART